MTIIEAVVLSIIQGIGEFLPISSSGHLILARWLMDLEISADVDILLHLATVISIVVILHKDIWRVTKRPFDYGLKILITIIPGGIIGYLINDFREEVLSEPWIIATMLILVGGVLIWLMTSFLPQRRQQSKANLVTSIENLTYQQALIVGLAQVLSFIPGTSRSGITTIGGVLAGLEFKWAVKYSFISGLPLILAAGLKGGYDLWQEGSFTTVGSSLITAFILTAIIGIVALRLLTGKKVEQIFLASGYYRILLGIILGLGVLFAI